jgi:hypothetical protein
MRQASGPRLVGGGDDDRAAPLGAADWLSLAAAPSFGLMAVLTAVHGQTDLFCVAANHGSFLGGMVPMYLIMGVFHSAPWVRLIGQR